MRRRLRNPSERCIHELFEEQVERTPHAIAMVQDDVALTYAELNAQADQLAHSLIALGVGPDRLVGLCAERRPHLVIGLLAILRAGGAYVALDPRCPRERLQELVSDADPVVMLADAADRQALAFVAVDDSVAKVSVDDPAGWATERDTNPEVAGLSSRHLAYVIYTSGSTGTPKGAQNEHRAIVNRLVWMQRAYRLDGTDMVLQKTPYSFDVSVWELFWTLMYGATMLLAAPEGQRDATYLAELIQQHGVTTVHFVPSVLTSFVEASKVERCTSLRRVISPTSRQALAKGEYVGPALDDELALPPDLRRGKQDQQVPCRTARRARSSRSRGCPRARNAEHDLSRAIS